MTRDESKWVGFNVNVTVAMSPRLAARVRLHLFNLLMDIEPDEAPPLEHDLPALWARTLDRQLNPFAETYEMACEDLAEDYRWFGEVEGS